MNSELQRYVKLTTWIRELSTPKIKGTSTAEDYREDLLRSFMRIGELAKINQNILNEHLYPLLDPNKDLTEEEMQTMREFCDVLMDPIAMENLDLPMIFVQAERLLKESEKKNDFRLKLITLDMIVISAYPLSNMTQRLFPSFDITFQYRDKGIEAAQKIIEYLEPEKFAQLPDDFSKEIVLINSRYISALFDWSDKEDPTPYCQRDMEMMERSLALADDPFYLEQAPNYDWKYHKFRTLQYITCFTEFNNSSGYTPDQLVKISAYTKQFIDFLRNEIPEMQEECTLETQELYLLRNCYFANEISKEEYREGLRKLFDRRKIDMYQSWTMYTNFAVPYEYSFTIDRNNITKEDIELLSTFYREMVSYIYHLPKLGVLSFVLTFLSDILRNYIEIPSCPSFKTTCLNLMAALHQPTYVHTLSVADFTVCLTKHLLDKDPEKFVGVLNTTSVDEVLEKRDEIIDFAMNSALLHDIGKLFVMETIITYERKLFSLEFFNIQAHPVVGAKLLEQYDSTRAYTSAALGHHRWYDNSDGYPESFDMNNSKDKTIISILTVADCLDASTDTVGRNYKEGKTFEQYLGELEEGKGTRYAPYLVDLLQNPNVKSDIENLLNTARDDNYRKTYMLLKQL